MNRLVLLVLLVALVEEPCQGNETNEGELKNELVAKEEDDSTSQWSRLLGTLDPARVAIFIVSLLLITHASQKAVKLDKESRDDASKEGVHELTWLHAVCFPVMGSVMLLIFFYFFEYIQYVYTVLTAVISTVALFNLILPAVQWCEVCLRDKQLLSARKIFHPVIIAVALSVAIATAWILTGHWLCLDLLGAAICVFMIQFIRVPSLKISTLLLVGLLLYDVFWVFYSSSFFKANVMVEVAVKKADNPVAAVAQKLHLPKVVQSSPPLSIPGKILVPSLSDGRAFAMLGLGDIVLPGLLLCFAMRVDSERSISSSFGGGGVRGGLGTTAHGLLVCCQQWSYFAVALVGYGCGLMVASFVADWYRVAQPALLYLVPGVLIPLIIKAFLQGEFTIVWNGPFSRSTSQPARTTETHGYHKVSQYSLLPV